MAHHLSSAYQNHRQILHSLLVIQLNYFGQNPSRTGIWVNRTIHLKRKLMPVVHFDTYFIIQLVPKLDTANQYNIWPRLNTFRPIQNGSHFADDTFKCIFVKENVRIFIKLSVQFVPRGPVNNIPALVQIIARRRPGDKPLPEPMMVYWRIYISLGPNELITRLGTKWLTSYGRLIHTQILET